MVRNPFETIRLRNILGGTPPPRPTFEGGGIMPRRNPIQEPQSDAERYFDEMDRIQNTVGPGIQRYREALNQVPNRADYKPGVFTRIAAALSGFGAGVRDPGAGIAVARSINEQPFHNAMTDYSDRLDTLKAGADIEQEETNSKLKYLQQARALGLKYDEYELKRLETEARMRNESVNAGSNRMRAEAYAKAQGRPRHQYRDTEQGILEINEDTGEQRIIPANTIAAGQLGVNRKNAATNAANSANSVRRTNIYERSEADASRRGWTGLSIRNRQAQNTGLTPTQQRGASIAALREMMNDEAFRDFIEIDADGTPMAVEDDGSEEYQIFLDALNAKIADSRGGR